MKNQDLVEEYPREYELTQFEKVLVTAKRAKDLHNADKPQLVISGRKTPYVALEEFNEGEIQLIYREVPAPAIADESEDDE